MKRFIVSDSFVSEKTLRFYSLVFSTFIFLPPQMFDKFFWPLFLTPFFWNLGFLTFEFLHVFFDTLHGSRILRIFSDLYAWHLWCWHESKVRRHNFWNQHFWKLFSIAPQPPRSDSERILRSSDTCAVVEFWGIYSACLYIRPQKFREILRETTHAKTSIFCRVNSHYNFRSSTPYSIFNCTLFHVLFGKHFH